MQDNVMHLVNIHVMHLVNIHQLGCFSETQGQGISQTYVWKQECALPLLLAPRRHSLLPLFSLTPPHLYPLLPLFTSTLGHAV